MDGRDLAIDRISDLPDPLITHILSFLTTKDAVHTCMLSKRWIDLWISMATLDFDNSIFGFNSEDKFLWFVHGVLNRRGFSPLDNFKLIWRSRSPRNHGVVEECINYAVACMPRVIYIHMDTDPNKILKLPYSLCNCVSVKEMSLLYGCAFDLRFIYIYTPKSINLPSLKKLELSHLFVMNDLIKTVLLGCPVLDELVLTSCWLMINEINSNVLKKLTMKKCCFSDFAKSITMKNTPSLVMVDLEIAYVGREVNLLGGLPNVTSLRLYTIVHFLEFFKKYIPNCPILNNLRRLELGEMTIRYGWNLVACFLQHSPNLKKLVLNFLHIFYCQPRKQSEVTIQEALLGNNSFQREFLDIVEIKIKESSEETVKEVVMILGAFIKTIGKIVIL